MKPGKAWTLSVGWAVAAVGLAASAGAQGKDPAAAASEQVVRGQKLYAENCAKCHGDAGQGTKKAPAVVGKQALPLDPPAGARMRKTQFRTAMDVAAFVVENMPGDGPGSLETDEYFAILAFDLKANGVELKQPVDEKVAAGIVLHK